MLSKREACTSVAATESCDMMGSRSLTAALLLDFVFLTHLLLTSHAPPAGAQLTVRYLDAENGTDAPDCITNGSVACKTLYYALDREDISNLELRVKPGSYNYSNLSISIIYLRGAENFTIRGDPDDEGEVVFRCRQLPPSQRFATGDLEIYDGANVTIMGITVENCGPNATGIFVEGVQSIFITNCTFRNNQGGGMWILNAEYVRIENSRFMNNKDTRPDHLANDVAFNFGTQNSGGIGLLYHNSSYGEAYIYNCVFINCSASVSPLNINDPRPQPYAGFGHGGALVIRFSNTSNTTVTVGDCVFENSTAYHSGGAVSITMIHHPRNNHVVIRNSSFDNCNARRTGGGLSVQVFDVEENNLVLVEDSNFTSCSAKEGGGALSLIVVESLASTSQSLVNSPTILRVNRTLFSNNSCPTGGSAVGLVSNARVDQFSLTASVQDSVFTGNEAVTQGALLMFRFPAELVGSVVFSYNRGGAVLMFQTKMDMSGSVVFEENRATMGGALTLEDESYVNLYSGVEVMFLNNQAESVGGAILANNPSTGLDIFPLFNTNCFIQYEVEKEGSKLLPPDEWNANMSFVNNSAGTAGAAIYAFNISVCSYTAAECLTGNTTAFNRSIFMESRARSPFLFQDNFIVGKRGVTTETVATEAALLNISTDRQSYSPGEELSIELQAFDQSGNRRQAIWGIEREEDTKGIQLFSLPNSSTVVPLIFKPNNFSQSRCGQQLPEDMPVGKEILEFFIIGGLNGEVVYKEKVAITVTCCHPGYMPEENTCSFTSDFPHVMRSEPSNRYIYINHGYYAGFYEDTSRNETYFATSLMPESFQNCSREGNRSGCLYKYDSPDEQCRGNRTGFMCGSCPDGQGVDLTLRSCKKCGPADAAGLVIICVLVVVGCLLVLIFNVGVPNHLKGFLFFAQVVGFVYQHGAASNSLSWDFHLSRVLGFSVYLPICPFTRLPALWTAAFGLLPSLLAIFTVTVYIISARVIKPLGKRTVFRGIWLIILFVYKYIADTVANILKCVALVGDNVGSRYSQIVFYYDGTVPCYSGKHLGFAIPALLLLVFVVLLGPALIILISFKRYKTTQAFTDVITDGVRLRMRWWGGVDLLRRLMFIVSLTVFDIFLPDYVQLSLCLVSVVVLGVLCFSKPYSDLRTNIIEALILLDLLLISLIFLNSRESVHVNKVVFQILLLLPFLYAFLSIICKNALKLWIKHTPLSPKEAIKSLPQKLQTQLRPRRVKEHPRGLLVKSSSLDRTGVVDSVALLGDEGGLESGWVRDSEYALYREELLESY